MARSADTRWSKELTDWNAQEITEVRGWTGDAGMKGMTGKSLQAELLAEISAVP